MRDKIIPVLRDRPRSVIRVRPGQPPFMQEKPAEVHPGLVGLDVDLGRCVPPATGPGAGLLGKARTAAAVGWWLADPEEQLDSRGTFGRWRLIRQPPAREVHERS